MLRIRVAYSGDERVLAVDGWLVDARVAVLEEETRRQLEAVDRLVLDLTGLRSIDRAGIELLRNWCVGRLVLVRAESLFVRTLLAQHGVPVADPSVADR